MNSVAATVNRPVPRLALETGRHGREDVLLAADCLEHRVKTFGKRDQFQPRWHAFLLAQKRLDHLRKPSPMCIACWLALRCSS